MDLLHVRNLLSLGKTLSDINLRVCIYARVSTDHLEQKKSLQNQLEHFKSYIFDNPNWTYVTSYVDDGISGTVDIKRDNFMKMMSDARGGLFDLIVTKEISRFSRNTLDSIKYTRLLLSYGVCVFFVSDNINTIFTDSELRLTIMASLAQDEVRRLSERVKFGMNRAIERGEILGNDMLYGYKKNKDTGSLEIIDIEAEIVKIIFELYVYKRYSLGTISKYLNVNYSNKTWYSSTVSRVIENPKYKGYYCGKKTRVVDYMSKKEENIPKEEWIVYKDNVKVPPIVSEELWDMANYRLNSRKKKAKNDNSYKDRYMYSSKIICSMHNSVFNRRIFRKNKDASWICNKYLKNGKSFCNMPIIRENELSCIFLDLLDYLKIKYSEVIDYLVELYKSFNSSTDYLVELLKRKMNCYYKKDKLLDLNLNKLLSDDDFFRKNENIINEIKGIDNDIERYFSSKVSNNFSYIYDENLFDLFFSNIVSFLLDRIVVLSRSFDNNIYLNIYLNYNFSLFGKKYVFKRGFDVVSTKRYEVFYYVNFIFN